ncbi:MAG: histidine phosphatase family protein [Cyclobacteriaceae bacterium]
MKSKKIYIIRHGQTDYNKMNMVQGRGINSSLNEHGRQQAELFYHAYKDVDFDKIYTSSLKRTQESVAGFIGDNIPFEKLKGLDEISWGDHEGQAFDPEMHQKYLKCIEQWQSGNVDAAVSGGESPNTVKARQQMAIDYILSNDNEETVLICSHGRAMRILVCWLLEKPLHEMEAFKHQNLGLYLLNYQDGKFSLVERNNVDHMAELESSNS